MTVAMKQTDPMEWLLAADADAVVVVVLDEQNNGSNQSEPFYFQE
jgi:hypothetical protein